MDIQRLKDIFEKAGTYAIVVGQNYTIDEMGSALSIYLTLKSLGKDVSVISGKEPLVEVSNLVGIDSVKSSFESASGDLIVSFPYQQDEIGKVSYTLEDGLLNIIVKPKDQPLSFGEKDVIFKRSGSNPEVIITVGVKRISELQTFFDVQSLKDTTIINIDRAGNNEGFGDVVIVGQGASSVSEQVANLMLSLGYPLDADISQNLIGGIVASTGNFQSPRTSSLAFEMAGILLRNGAKREALRSQNPGQTRTPQQFGYNMTGDNQPQIPPMPSMPGLPPMPRPQMNQPRQQQARAQMPRPQRAPMPRPQIPPMPSSQRSPLDDDQLPPPPMPRSQKSPIDDDQMSPMSQNDKINQINQQLSSMSGDYQKEAKIDDAPIDTPDAPPDWLAPKIFKGSTTVE